MHEVEPGRDDDAAEDVAAELRRCRTSARADGGCRACGTFGATGS